jgi:hypothetical protein
VGGNPRKFSLYLQESQRPIWRQKAVGSDGGVDKYGKLDTTQFSELELRLYSLIKAGKASMRELKTCYTLDQALKLHALVRMDIDIEAAQSKEISDKHRKTGR